MAQEKNHLNKNVCNIDKTVQLDPGLNNGVI